MSGTASDPIAEIARLKRRFERERAIRLEAEAIAERGLRDLYDRQRQLEVMEHVAAASNQMHSVRDVLQLAVEQFCAYAGWSLGHAFVRDGGVLRSANAWHVADPAATAMFRAITAARTFAPGEGLPGLALESGKPVWIANLVESANFPRLRCAEECGLRSGVAFPILFGSETVAVVEFFATEARKSDPGLLDLMAQAGLQLGRAIERQHTKERLEAQTVALAAARDEAKAADKAKSAFLANMSHELRTPLNAIIGFSDIMLNGLFGKLVPRYAGYVSDIRDSGAHLKDILNDILDLSKIHAGGLELRCAPVHLADAADICRRILAPLAEKAQVALTFDIPSGLPAFALDETRFRQALINILSNAVKFTQPGGSVLVRIEQDKTGWSLAVEDSGIGMTPEGVVLALKPFRQVDSALNRRYEGTGLGLPLSKALMELHGGQLSIESAPGKGTIVRLHLPPGAAAIAA